MDAVGSIEPAIVCHFIVYPQVGKCETGEADGKPDDGNNALRLVFQQVSECCFDVMSYHD